MRYTNPTDPEEVIYGPLPLKEVVISAPKNRNFWQQLQHERQDRYKELAKSPAGALWAPFEMLFIDAPQAALSRYVISPLAGREYGTTLVDKALGIENPYLALAATLAFDPWNAVGLPAKGPRLLKAVKNIDALSAADEAATLVKDLSQKPAVQSILNQSLSAVHPSVASQLKGKVPVVSRNVTNLKSPVASVANIYDFDRIAKMNNAFAFPPDRSSRFGTARQFLKDIPTDEFSLKTLRDDYPFSLEVIYPYSDKMFASSLAHETAHLGEYLADKALSPQITRQLNALTDGYFTNARKFSNAVEKALLSYVPLEQTHFTSRKQLDDMVTMIAANLARLKSASEPLMKSTDKVLGGKALREALTTVGGIDTSNNLKSILTSRAVVHEALRGSDIMPALFQSGYITDYSPALKIGESYAHMKEMPFLGLAPFVSSVDDFEKVKDARKLFLDIYDQPSKLANALQSGLYSAHNQPDWIRTSFGDLRIFRSLPPTEENVKRVLEILKNIP